MTDKQLISELRKYRCADLSDGMDAIGLVNKGTMNQDMRPLRPGMEFKGFAYTVKLVPTQESVKVCTNLGEWKQELGRWCNDIYAFNNGITKESAPDMVVVIDMGGAVGGVWGSEIGAATKVKGIEGAIIDGACRDSYETNLEEVNVFCTRRTFNHAYGRVKNAGINVPVQCAGVTVKPGDVICADDDGVLVIPRERAEDVLQFAKLQLEEDIETRTTHYKNLGMKEDDTLTRNR